MKDEDRKDRRILLESGANEVEILEFLIAGRSFGVNVAKIQAVLHYDIAHVTRLPKARAAILGVYLFRGQPIPLVDLGLELGIGASDQSAERRIVLATEFNNLRNCFLVDGVSRIHRVSWECIVPLSGILAKRHARMVGSVHIDGTEILLVDLETIVASISGRDALSSEGLPAMGGAVARSRGDLKLVIAEDSNLIRETMLRLLREAGYGRITAFSNGKEAYDRFQAWAAEAKEAGRGVPDHCDLLVTDIEMPQMDGLTLCRRLRETLLLKDLPVMVFSSLVNDQMVLKCREVGATDHISKPELGLLVERLDRILLGKVAP